jgi:hypothetical protein
VSGWIGFFDVTCKSVHRYNCYVYVSGSIELLGVGESVAGISTFR